MKYKTYKNYPEKSVEKYLLECMPDFYCSGWNDYGTPAIFTFKDGVTVTYEDKCVDDLDEFEALYDQQVGFRLKNKTGTKIYEDRDEDLGTPFWMSFTVNYTAKRGLFTGLKEVPLVEVTLLQADGNGPVAGNVIIARNINKIKLLNWIKQAIANEEQVERVEEGSA